MAAKRTTAELLALGVASHQKLDPKKAAEHFAEAAKNCPCLTGDPFILCECKDLMRAIEKEELLDCLRKSCTCKVRSKRHCDSEEHMLALSYLAAIVRDQGLTKKALQCAQKMVFAQPRDPRGYLRIGQMLRLQQKPKLALKTYTQGLAIVEAKSPDHRHIGKLREQVQEVSKLCRTADPMILPLEVKVMIFQQLSLVERCRCLKVSRQWRQFLFSGAASILWSRQTYEARKGPTGVRPCRPTEQSLKTNLGRLGGSQIASLEVSDCFEFDMSAKRINLIFIHGKNLQHLRLGGRNAPLPPLGLPNDISVAGIQRLKTLHISGLKLENAFLQALLTASANTLEELLVTAFPRSYQELSWPLLPKLAALNLAGNHQGHIIDMDCIMRQTPNVTRVMLDQMSLVEHPTRDTPSSPRWEKLEDVTLSASTEFVHPTMLPRISENLRALALTDEHALMLSGNHWKPHWRSMAFSLNATYNFNGATAAAARYNEKFLSTASGCPRLAKLRELALDGAMIVTTQITENIVLGSIKSNTLRALELDPLPDKFIRLAQSKDGLPSCESLLAFSFSGANPAAGSGIRDLDSFLMTLMTTFPNLKVLSIDQEPFSPATLGKAIKQGVKYIYHGQAHVYDEVQRWAAKEGLAKVMRGRPPHPILKFVEDEFRDLLM